MTCLSGIGSGTVVSLKTIGLIGGMSWESSAVYYHHLNMWVKNHLGGLHSAKAILLSVDFAEVAALQHDNRWDELTAMLCAHAQSLEKAGADIIAIATNTMHCVADAVQASVSIPLLHIADATANAIKTENVGCVGLLGTRFTMEGAFYKDRLETPHGLSVVIPNESDRAEVHRIIYEELCQGIISNESRKNLLAVIQRLADAGAQGVILGCTELSLLVTHGDATLPLFDTTAIHAHALAEMSARETGARV